jgi:hypothetical protein
MCGAAMSSRDEMARCRAFGDGNLLMFSDSEG